MEEEKPGNEEGGERKRRGRKERGKDKNSDLLG